MLVVSAPVKWRIQKVLAREPDVMAPLRDFVDSGAFCVVDVRAGVNVDMEVVAVAWMWRWWRRGVDRMRHTYPSVM